MNGKTIEDFLLNRQTLQTKRFGWLILCGALIGLLNGFFGGGGGMICVPLLEDVLKFPSKIAHATALLIIFPISLVSAAIYFLSGNLQFVPFITTSTGVLFGGILGAFLLKFLPTKTIKIAFVVIMFLGGVHLIF